MSTKKKFNEESLHKSLEYLKMQSVTVNYNPMAKKAASKQWSYPAYLSELLEEEVNQRLDRRIETYSVGTLSSHKNTRRVQLELA